MPREAAQDIGRILSLTPRLVTEIVGANPYLGLKILQIKSSWLFSNYADDYARSLLLDSDSVLYRELRRSENLDRNGWPIIDQKEQPLIHALCKDAVRPEGPSLIYTFLDAGIDPLRPERGGKLRGVLNGPTGDFRERGRWVSPPFATIYLLQIVGPRIAASPMSRPINLYLMRTLTTELLRQIDPDDDVELFWEWPTPTHYLLYEAVVTLVELVRLLIPKDESAERPKANVDRTSDALPEQAIEVLGAVMYECMKSPQLDGKFKAYLLGVWWRAYSDKYQGGWPHTEKVLAALVKGGAWARHTDHHEAIAEALQRIDTVLQYSKAGEALLAQLDL
jgi:hypothetical protein